MSVANLNNSMILHRSTMAKKEEKLKAMERQQALIHQHRSKARVTQQLHKPTSETVMEAHQDDEEGRAYSASDSFEEL